MEANHRGLREVARTRLRDVAEPRGSGPPVRIVDDESPRAVCLPPHEPEGLARPLDRQVVVASHREAPVVVEKRETLARANDPLHVARESRARGDHPLDDRPDRRRARRDPVAEHVAPALLVERQSALDVAGVHAAGEEPRTILGLLGGEHGALPRSSRLMHRAGQGEFISFFEFLSSEWPRDGPARRFFVPCRRGPALRVFCGSARPPRHARIRLLPLNPPEVIPMRVRLAVALSLTLTLAAPSAALAAPAPGGSKMLTDPALSADQVAFVYGNDIWTCRLDGSSVQRITSGPGVKMRPAFSPDGSLLAFSAELDGNLDVFVVPAAGGVPKRLTWHP